MLALSDGVFAVAITLLVLTIQVPNLPPTRLLMSLNTLLLLTVSFLPLPTGVIGRYPGSWVAVVFYALSLALTGVMTFLLWWYASRAYRLIDAHLEKNIITYYEIRFLIPPAIFLLSIGLAFVNILLPAISGPNLAEYSWVLIAVALTIYERLYRKRTKLQRQSLR